MAPNPARTMGLQGQLQGNCSNRLCVHVCARVHWGERESSISALGGLPKLQNSRDSEVLPEIHI